MRLRKKFAAIAVTAALAATLTACGGNDDESDTGSEDETSEATDDESAETESDDADETESDDADSDSEGSAGDLTEPGSTLSIGDTATVPYDYAGEEGVIEVTVVSIEEGSPEDLADVDGDVEGLTAYYVTYEITGVENAENLGGMSLSLDGLDADDNPGTGIISFTGGVDGCESESAESDWDGSTWQDCALIASAEPIEKAIFAEGDDYSWYDDNQITWE